jgi:hypothetical protein
MKRKKMDVPLFFDLALGVVCLVLVWLHWHQARRIDELWAELDAQRGWLSALEQRDVVETDGVKTEARKVR